MAGLVSTAMPSKATLSSTYSMPLAAQVSASSSLMGRLASEMSVSPSQNTANPSPVPGPLTVTCIAEPASSASSATFSETGWTVDDPEMFTAPSPPEEEAPSSSSSSPQAVATRANEQSTARGNTRRRNRFFTGEPSLGVFGGTGRRSDIDQRGT